MSDTFRATDRITLRRWRQDDIGFLWDMLNDPQVTRYLGTTGPIVRDRVEERLGRTIARYEAGGLHQRYAIVENAGGKLVGNVGLEELPDRSETEIAYQLVPAAWGRGLATDAAALMLAHAWELGHRFVIGLTFQANVASQRVLEKIGMTYQGTGLFFDHELFVFTATAPEAQDARAAAPFVRETVEPASPDRVRARLYRGGDPLPWGALPETVGGAFTLADGSTGALWTGVPERLRLAWPWPETPGTQWVQADLLPASEGTALTWTVWGPRGGGAWDPAVSLTPEGKYE